MASPSHIYKSSQQQENTQAWKHMLCSSDTYTDADVSSSRPHPHFVDANNMLKKDAKVGQT
jgi:hypothetical protein